MEGQGAQRRGCVLRQSSSDVETLMPFLEFPGFQDILISVFLNFAFSFVEKNWYDDNQKPYQKTDFFLQGTTIGGNSQVVVSFCFEKLL